MTLENLYQLLESTGLPVVYRAWPIGGAPELPYICYLAAYIMARQYDANIPDTPEGWLDGFETFSIYEVLPAILELWAINAQTTAKSKKK